MDFLSRLIGGVASPPNRKSAANNPQQRLARFKKTYNSALQAYQRVRIVKNDPTSVDVIRTASQRLTNLLQDDTRAPAPHLCLAFASSYQVYSSISEVAVALANEDVVREVVAIHSVLVDSDEENLLENETFAREIMRFIRALTEKRLVRISHQTEGEVLELAFSIAAKIRLEPDLLPVWFRPRKGPSVAASNGTVSSGDENPFPLCFQFVANVYNEGRAGDFARTGLLYIFETASHYNGLEEYIVSSDMPTMMATGLGALYSQLSRKVSIAHPDDRLPLILALSDNDLHPVSGEADSFYSESLQSRLTTFMSNLVFWQDILEHCRSLEIKQTLIDHFQVFFLQQILYPSLLESSDIDGGSSVAVLTYLWRILDSVDHPDMIHLILKYLLAISDDFTAPRPGSSSQSPSSDRRRETLKQKLEDQGGDDTLNPSFFNLVDLINTSVRSSNVETITAALRLVTVILNKHHQHAISSLVKSIPFRQTALTRTMGSLRKDLDIYLGLAESIGGGEAMDEAYENCLKDGATLVETHICSPSKIGLETGANVMDTKRRGAILDNRPKDLHDHLLLPDDPLLQALMDLMRTFFTNDIETNLGLTGVLSHFASCPYTRLEGWLVLDVPLEAEKDSEDMPDGRILDETIAASAEDGQDDEEPKGPTEEERIRIYKRTCRKPTTTPPQEPPMMQVLRTLNEQLDEVKKTIGEMNHFISGRKRAFQGAAELENEVRSFAPSIVSPKISRDASRESSRSRASSATPRKTGPVAPGQAGPRGRPTNGVSPSPRMPLSPSMRPKSPLATAPPMTLDSRTMSPSPAAATTRAKSPLKKSLTLRPEDAEVQSVGGRSVSGESSDAGKNDGEAEEEEIFERKLQFPFKAPAENDAREKERQQPVNGTGREATLNHVLTNVIILQEFVLEVTAIIQVRSSLLEGEIKFM